MKASVGRVLGLVLGLTSVCGTARGGLLNLSFPSGPDLLSSFIDVTYDAGTDVFSARGFSLELNGSPLDLVGEFEISAIIDGSGILGAGGTLSIGGTLGTNGPLLLTGDLTDFGFRSTPGGDPFEFLFDVTGGDLAGLLGGIGGQGGIILTAGFGAFGGSFSSSFDNLMSGVPGSGVGFADVALIPEPTTILLVMAGMGMIGSRRRRRT